MTVGARQPPPGPLVLELLVRAGRLLLEYNESTGAIHRTLTATAAALTDEPCRVAVSYRGVTVWVGGQGPALETVSELRYNMALLARVHSILERVRRGDLEPAAAVAELGKVESDTPRHSQGVIALALGVGAAALATLLGADGAAAGVAGVAAGLGLLVRQELGRRHFSLLALPLTAALVGAALGGLAIQFGWTRTPELVLIVPALVVVPGPHLINGLLDLIDNHLPMSLARLGLAAGVLLAAALGVVLGLKLTVTDPTFPGSAGRAEQLTLWLDLLLAGAVACGFGVFYNTAWGHLWMAAAGGMAGHGLRYLALQAGYPLDTATFAGGLVVGATSACLARWSRTPVAVIAFAGAVTMVPGLDAYRSLGGALRLARQTEAPDPAAATAAVGNAFEAALVLGALTLGLLIGARLAQAVLGRLAPQPITPSRAAKA